MALLMILEDNNYSGVFQQLSGKNNFQRKIKYKNITLITLYARCCRYDDKSLDDYSSKSSVAKGGVVLVN